MNQRIYQFIILLPIIDIATAFTEGWTLSLGAVIRPLLMSVILIYIWIIDPLEKKYLLLFLFAYMTIGITFIINYYMKTPFFFMEEVSFFLKVAYYVTMLFLSIHIITRKKIAEDVFLQVVHLALFLICITYWIAYFTQTNLDSYAYMKAGYSGWYFSANELSVIILILFALVLLYFLRYGRMMTALTILLTIFTLPMIGTKTALYGGVILFIPIFFYTIWIRYWSQTFLFSIFIAFWILLLPFTPASTNQIDVPIADNKTNEAQESSLLSSRDVYLKNTLNDYKAAHFSQKIFGLGYAGNYKKAAKTIEMDFYDLFFSFGLLGTIILLLPLVVISYHIVRWQLTFSYVYSMGTLLLVMGISFVAGHVLFAPAVMSYLALLVIWTGSIANE